jgi:hypothetical protein
MIGLAAGVAMLVNTREFFAQVTVFCRSGRKSILKAYFQVFHNLIGLDLTSSTSWRSSTERPRKQNVLYLIGEF